MGRRKRRPGSRRWLDEHHSDHWVQQAQKAGYRSRAAFKLLEIQEKDRLIRPGMTVVDLGAAPGGWCQVAAELVGDRGAVFALDILPMEALPGVHVIQGDFTEEAPLQALLQALEGRPVDLVLSDMAPNLSGVRVVDQPRAMYLAELALDFAGQVLQPGGDFLTKVFHGEGLDDYRRDLQRQFSKVITRKPRASRARSRESYLLARGFGL
ncbi:23S rRNA (uridine(2552)-2'-O)-methyltransferase RlmE [Alkalilimnicola ehrlichii MLHE-1]|uniref:Ribosomal RNA large subunit methyltransferase E n=1 Tax=Alkalilimnicola ehrlichii (strain ATCC BAA-1101 / DSM 17681 / MLHE-1) TaxID=187272 RepID=RLME_ALKEH|nr:23S rRNA (uridine(2552)-2'-O)-methyltransferase RlmE [Alkalilimnicola ehrlichii]Q0A769.1 RecName: Full=Ribosomal RNA large subunit methyltransferase E; AltName: Full=23S rRNA Um2552 methyltransferase; AltName: Full=rRNA (uridine-2'-O-)-methyltransferase [Alkalilimnicola ehrlichii MLHE-1]ABI57318.1 23S rRNA Um-2552 2'-O-methyltransferase [Alkalilimnicola ehrlichii MLHE-1]